MPMLSKIIVRVRDVGNSVALALRGCQKPDSQPAHLRFPPQQKSGHVTGLLETNKSAVKSLQRLIATSDVPDDVKGLVEKWLIKLNRLD